MGKDTQNGSAGEWEFNIDLESIRAEAEAEKRKEEEETKSLMAQIDALTADAENARTPDDLDPMEETRVLKQSISTPKETAEDTTGEQTIVIPAVSASSSRREENRSEKRPERTTRPASSAGQSARSAPRRPVSPARPSAANSSSGGQLPPVAPPALSKKAAKAQKKREKRLARVERSRQRPKFRLAPVLASLLAITNVITLGALGLNYIQTRMTVQEAEKTASDAQAQAEAAKAAQEEVEKNSIPLDTFTYNVAEYNITTEFIQEFFDDRIVYKDTSVHYAEIDDSLPKNEYDWSALKWENGRPSYQPETSRHSSLGIDVSYHQGEIDWDAVKADGIDFAIIRCGYRGYGSGDLVTDSCYEGNITRAKESGLETGVYFFSQALNAEEAVEEADYVLSLIDGRGVTMPVVYDMEILDEDARANELTSSQRAEVARAFCDRIKEGGYTPMIYGNTAYYMSKIDYEKIAADYGIWLAQYYKKPFFPYQFSMWQYTASGTVDGIDGKVDLNLYFGE